MDINVIYERSPIKKNQNSIITPTYTFVISVSC